MYEDFKEEVSALQDKVSGYSHQKPIVFYGSSSFRLWETLKQDIPELDIINLAFGGSNLGACSFYFDQVFKGLQPPQIVIYCGDNDVVDGFNMEKVLVDFNNLLDKIKDNYPHTKCTFASIKPSPIKSHLLKEIQKVNRGIHSIIKTHSNCNYLELHSYMLNEKGEVNADLFTEDDLHMNSEGYVVWKRLFRSYFELN